MVEKETVHYGLSTFYKSLLADWAAVCYLDGSIIQMFFIRTLIVWGYRGSKGHMKIWDSVYLPVDQPPPLIMTSFKNDCLPDLLADVFLRVFWRFRDGTSQTSQRQALDSYY